MRESLLESIFATRDAIVGAGLRVYQRRTVLIRFGRVAATPLFAGDGQLKADHARTSEEDSRCESWLRCRGKLKNAKSGRIV
jgi:hypothetical protein